MNQRISAYIGSKLRPIELAELVKRILRIKRHEHQFQDFKMYVDPASNFGNRLIKDGYYEPLTSEIITSILNEGDTFVDVGANEGYFSVFSSKRIGKKGRIISIEPQKRLGEVVLQNYRINGLTNATLLPFGAGEKEESAEIIITPSINTGSSTILQSKRNRFWKKERIFIRTIDEMLSSQRVEEVHLMKMDIEGFEVFALKGLQSYLSQKKIKNLLVEFHPKQIQLLDSSIEELKTYLNSFGYVKSDKYEDLFVIKDDK